MWWVTKVIWPVNNLSMWQTKTTILRCTKLPDNDICVLVLTMCCCYQYVCLYQLKLKLLSGKWNRKGFSGKWNNSIWHFLYMISNYSVFLSLHVCHCEIQFWLLGNPPIFADQIDQSMKWLTFQQWYEPALRHQSLLISEVRCVEEIPHSWLCYCNEQSTKSQVLITHKSCGYFQEGVFHGNLTLLQTVG